MPQFANKLGKEEAKALAAFVRSFGPSETKHKEATGKDFETQLQELFEQMKELRQHFRELSKTPGKP